ncbi:MAG: hybrid sensor histidine kinase/response regulator [Verrucomicrobiota bacterium]|nr:hybrid sensor histidine kinase/response regulator [Verrucomicrobiota bacterium]
MQNFYDYKRFAILYVDDEEKSLKYFTRAFEEHFRVFTASNAQDGFRLLEEHKDEIGILMTDQRMPGEKGVQLLERARQLRPKIVRILATAYSDLDAAIDAVNSGAIYKYVHKPWDVPQLEITLRRALEFFLVSRERDTLLREKLAVLHHIMIAERVVSLGVLAAGLGHHMRNALVAVRTFLDLAPDKMREEKVDVEELRNPNFWQDFYSHVQNQIKRIMELLTDLGFAAEPNKVMFNDSVNLNTLVSGVAQEMAPQFAEKGVQLKLAIPTDLPAMQVDEKKFRRLFDLLFKDELVNLPSGSAVNLSATLHNGVGNLPEIEIIVSDNGQGLPAEALRSVFDPFYVRTDDPQEFGLNLMACYLIVYHHGGRISVDNQEGGGTRFIVHMPVSARGKSDFSERDFLGQVLSNEALWERLLAGA